MTPKLSCTPYAKDPCWCCKSSRTDYRQRVAPRRILESIRQAAVLESFSTETCRVGIQDDSSAPFGARQCLETKDTTRKMSFRCRSHFQANESNTLNYLPHVLHTQQHERTHSQARFHPCPRPATDFQNRLKLLERWMLSGHVVQVEVFHRWKMKDEWNRNETSAQAPAHTNLKGQRQ